MRKEWRLRSPKLFKKIYQEGKYYFNDLLVIHFLVLDDETKVGLSVSKKVGSAVVRNKIKRRLRAILRPLFSNLKKGAHIVFVARPAAATASFDQLQDSVINLLKTANLLESDE